MGESTFIGLDVHARSVWAGVLEGATGEVRSCAAPVRSEELIAWLRAQGESLSVAYEAGPTGFGLARACAAARIPCMVAAPSKIAKAPGERVKTDRRDAPRLARLLRLGELTAVRVPSTAEEGARDLVRAREDARSDLMRARHRLSKLLLRQGLVWEASAWTQAHERWFASQRFEARPGHRRSQPAAAQLARWAASGAGDARFPEGSPSKTTHRRQSPRRDQRWRYHKKWTNEWGQVPRSASASWHAEGQCAHDSPQTATIGQ